MKETSRLILWRKTEGESTGMRGRSVSYNMHHSVSRRWKSLPSPTSYSDRCTVKAVISGSPEIRYECQYAKETLSVRLVSCQTGCESRKKKRPPVGKVNDCWKEKERERLDEEQNEEGEGLTWGLAGLRDVWSQVWVCQLNFFSNTSSSCHEESKANNELIQILHCIIGILYWI